MKQLSGKDRRDTISDLCDLNKGAAETISLLIAYANEPSHIKSEEEFLSGFEVLRDQVTKAETAIRARIIKKGKGGAK